MTATPVSGAYARVAAWTRDARPRGGIARAWSPRWCARSTPGRPRRSVVALGPLRERAGAGRAAPAIAICTDGVGTKLIVAEQAGRFDTVGIDCVAMNVNDLVCVGAEPIAMVDYIAVEQADPSVLAAIGEGLRARRRAGRDRDPRRRARAGARR